ncbi:gastrula zinc finger protein XlCGF26.1-like isoform X21 [Euwallacea similis]|uniref:gastrula zinc finger protein XlCGF26.1-like isoform X21 n=1 Tax=Euwallacea similis TaxID=1736056 RepID=UPI00344FD3C3
MDNPGEILRLCRLCLVKDQVNIPIFEEQGDIRQTFLKIRSCLPVKVSRDDKLPKKICGGCSNKLDLFYEFWSSTANSEKTLQSWLGQEEEDDKMQEITKPVEALVKEESEALEDGHAHDQSFDEATKDEAEAPPAKRARRTAAVKAQINISHDSDEDEDVDGAEPITKIEDESDDSDGEEKDPSYTEVPGTSADDQAGPSGLGKDGVEAPYIEEIKIEVTADYSDEENDLNEQSEDVSNGVQSSAPLYVLLTKDGYKCPHCPAIYKNIDDLKSHFSVHKHDNTLRCTICYDEFSNAAALSKHLTIFHEVQRKYPCRCGQMLASLVNYQRHLAHCEFPNKKGYSSIKNEENHVIFCNACNASFKDETEHNEHWLISHVKRVEFDKFRCLRCDKEYSTLKQIMGHYKQHAQEKKYHCHHCGKGFITEKFLELHVKSDHVETGVICTICGKSLRNRITLNAHMRGHNPHISNAGTCEICKKYYRNLKQHQQDAHESLLTCTICGKIFTSERGLQLHIMIHKGDKRFTCEFCGKRFLMNTFLQNHLRTHPESGVDPFTCEDCGKTFSRRVAYVDHMNSHSGHKPFRCQFCSKTFDKRKSYAQHKRIKHLGVRSQAS